MAASHRQSFKLHIKSTSSVQHDSGRGRGSRRDTGRVHGARQTHHNYSSGYRSKESASGGGHTSGHGGSRGRGRGGHQEYAQKRNGSDHTAVKVSVLLDQTTISDSHEPYKGKDKIHYQQKEFSGRSHGKAESHG